MSSSREAEATLHVGRVVDPSVRDDGELEPEVQLAMSPVGESEPSHSEAASPKETSAGSVPVEPAPAPPRNSTLPGTADPGFGLRSPLLRPDEQVQAQRDRELDLVGTDRIRLTPPVHPGATEPKHQLSPGWIAVFGALLGLCTVATLIAIAIQIDKKPHKITDAPLATAAKPVPTASVAAPSPPPDNRPARVKIPGPWRIRDAAGDATARIIEGKVGLDPLVKSIDKAGVPLKQFYRVLTAFSKVRPLNNCAKTDRYVVLLDRGTKRIKAFEYITSNDDVFQAKEGSDGLLTVQKLDLQIKQNRVAHAFVIGDDGLESAAVAGGFEKAIIPALREALSGHAALEELERGTRLRIVAQELTTLGDFSRYAGIEVLEIAYPDESKKHERIYYFGSATSRGYYDASGRAPYSGGWRKPIQGAPITSHFNPNRMHPILHKIMPHQGTDFGSPSGTPVGASSFGTVTFVGFAGPTGNFVRISHPGDIETGYAHLSRFAEGLKVGDKVKRLQIIGYVGSTGRSTGPHLHFSAKRAGKFIDPESLNLDGLRTLDASERPQFDQTKGEFDRLLDAIAWPAPLAAPPAANVAAVAAAASVTEEPHSAAAAPSANNPAPAAPAGHAAPAGNAVYLTDDELKRSQPTSDDGEVEE